MNPERTLDQWYNLAARVEAAVQQNMKRERPREKEKGTEGSLHAMDATEPKKCWNCGGLGHLANNCSNEHVPGHAPKGWKPKKGKRKGNLGRGRGHAKEGSS